MHYFSHTHTGAAWSQPSAVGSKADSPLESGQTARTRWSGVGRVWHARPYCTPITAHRPVATPMHTCCNTYCTPVATPTAHLLQHLLHTCCNTYCTPVATPTAHLLQHLLHTCCNTYADQQRIRELTKQLREMAGREKLTV